VNEQEKLSKILYYSDMHPDNCQFIQDLIDNKDKEIERLNKIINELEIHLKILLESCYQLEDEYDLNMKIETIEEISQKLQELKGSDKE
jgi:hypothetical protein